MWWWTAVLNSQKTFSVELILIHPSVISSEHVASCNSQVSDRRISSPTRQTAVDLESVWLAWWTAGCRGSTAIKLLASAAQHSVFITEKDEAAVYLLSPRPTRLPEVTIISSFHIKRKLDRQMQPTKTRVTLQSTNSNCSIKQSLRVFYLCFCFQTFHLKQWR